MYGNQDLEFSDTFVIVFSTEATDASVICKKILMAIFSAPNLKLKALYKFGPSEKMHVNEWH